MSALLLILFFLIVIISLFIKDKLAKSLFLIYLFLLFLQLSFAEIDILNIRRISNTTFLSFILNMVSFVLGGVIFGLITRKSKINGNFSFSELILSNRTLRAFIYISVSIFLLYLYFGYRMFNYISLLDYTSDARAHFYSSSGFFESYVERFLYFNILGNSNFFSAFILVLIIFNKKNKNTLGLVLLFFSVINIIAGALIALSRLSIMPVFIFILLFLLLFKIQKFRINYKGILSTFAVIALLFISISMFRSNTKSIFMQSSFFYDTIFFPIASYFSLPISAYDFIITTLPNEPLTLGVATFSGIQQFFILPITLIDKTIQPYSVRLEELTIPFNYFNGIEWNALYTAGLNYYMDFRIFGFVVFPMLFGFLLNAFVYLFNLRKRLIYLFCLFLYFYMMFVNIQKCAFENVSIPYMIIFILLFLLWDKYKIVLK